MAAGSDYLLPVIESENKFFLNSIPTLLTIPTDETLEVFEGIEEMGDQNPVPNNLYASTFETNAQAHMFNDPEFVDEEYPLDAETAYPEHVPIMPDVKTFLSPIIETITNVKDRYNESVESVKKFFSDVKNSVGDFAEITARIKAKFDAVPSFNEVFDNVIAFFNTEGNTKITINVIIACVTLALVIAVAATKGSLLSIAALATWISAATVIGGTYCVVSAIQCVDAINYMVHDHQAIGINAVPTGCANDVPTNNPMFLIYNAFAIICHNLTHTPLDFFKNHYNSFQIFWSSLGKIARDTNSIAITIEHLRSAWTYFGDLIHLWWYGFPRGVSEEKVTSLITYCMRLVNTPYVAGTHLSGVFPYLSKSIDILIRATVNTSRTALVQTLVNLKNQLDAKQVEFAEKEFNNRRGGVPAFSVFIYGPSHVGKSSHVSKLAEAAASILVGDSQQARVYYRVNDPKKDFYDGYQQEPVMVVDDFGQVVDVEGMGGDWIELIKWINVAKYQLNMAELEAKKATFFTTPFVILTSNLVYPINLAQIKSIISPDAVNNRLHLVLKMSGPVTNPSFEVMKSVGKAYDPLDQKRPTLQADTLVGFVMQQYFNYYDHQQRVQSALGKFYLDQAETYLDKSAVIDAEAFLAFSEMQLAYKSLTTQDKKLIDAYEKIVYKKDKTVLLRPVNTKQSARLASTREAMLAPTYDLQAIQSLNDEEYKILGLYEGNLEEQQWRLAIYTKFMTAKARSVPINCLKTDAVHEPLRLADITKGADFYTVPSVVFEKVKKRIKTTFTATHACMCTGSPQKHHIDLDDKDVDDLNPEDVTALCSFNEQVKPTWCAYHHLESIIKLNRSTTPSLNLNDMNGIDQNPHLEIVFRCCWVVDKEYPNGWRFNFPAYIEESTIKRINFSLVRHLDEHNLSPIHTTWYSTFFRSIFQTSSILPFFGIVGGALSLLALWKMYTTAVEGPPAHASDPKIYNRNLVRPGRLAKAKDAYHDHMIAEIAAQSHAFEGKNEKVDSVTSDLVSIVSAQQAKLYAFDPMKPNERFPLVNVLWIDSQTFLMVAHAVRKCEGRLVQFQWPGKGVCWDNATFTWASMRWVPMKDFDLREQTDLVLVRLPRNATFPGIRSLYEKFLKKPNYTLAHKQRAIFLDMERDEKSWVAHWITLSEIEYQYRKFTYEGTIEGQKVIIVVPQIAMYPYSGKNGSCTSPILAVNSHLSGGDRIQAVHVAGLKQGYAVPCSAEQINDARASLDARCGKPIEYVGVVDQTYTGALSLETDGVQFHMSPEKALDLPFVSYYDDEVYLPTETSIIPSPLYGTTPVYKAPVLLKPFEDKEGVWKNPLLIGMQKFVRPQQYLDPQFIKAAVNSYINKLKSCTKYNCERRLLTIEEAVFGVEGDKYLPSIRVQTSPGYPWVKNFHNGKKKLIDLDKRWIHPELRAAVQYELDCCYNREVTSAVFTDTMKDERRPIPKIVKPRIFSCGELAKQIVGRMLFGMWVKWMMLNRGHNEQWIGMNPYSPEWSLLVALMKERGDDIDAGDFKDFDASLVAQLVQEFPYIVNAFYGNEDFADDARIVYCVGITSALHMVKGNFYFIIAGNPSGNALTGFINGVYGSLLFRYIFYKRAYEIKAFNFDFNMHVTLAMYGDDNMKNVSSDVQHFFNPFVVQEECSKIGMTYTAADKTDNVTGFVTLDQASFLKRGFVWSEQFACYLAPLDINTILDTVNWTYKGVPHDVLSGTLSAVIRELALHGEETFDHWCPIIIDAAYKHQYDTIEVLPWYSYLEIACTGSGEADFELI
jgi:hypothetical protein